MQYNGSSSPKKFSIIQAKKITKNNGYNTSTQKGKECYAGYESIECGPFFGNGDIKTFSGNIKRTRNYFNLNGSVNCLGNSYALNGESSNSITNNNLQVSDLEVYRVLGKCSKSLSTRMNDSATKTVKTTVLIHFIDIDYVKNFFVLLTVKVPKSS